MPICIVRVYKQTALSYSARQSGGVCEMSIPYG